MTLGSAIKLIRIARGVKQVKLARRLKVSANYVSLLEKDKREPSVSLLRGLAAELSVPVSMFFMWQDLDASGTSKPELKQLGELLVELQALITSAGEHRRGRRRKAA